MSGGLLEIRPDITYHSRLAEFELFPTLWETYKNTLSTPLPIPIQCRLMSMLNNLISGISLESAFLSGGFTDIEFAQFKGRVSAQEPDAMALFTLIRQTKALAETRYADVLDRAAVSGDTKAATKLLETLAPSTWKPKEVQEITVTTIAKTYEPFAQLTTEELRKLAALEEPE